MNHTLFIGGGNMAFAIIGGLLSQGEDATQFRVIDPSPEASRKLNALGIECGADWPENFAPEVVVLAVKPQMMKDVLQAHGASLGDSLIISIAAGVSVAQIRQWSGQVDAKVVRCMPNTPALVGEGVSGLYFTANCDGEDREEATAIFESCGKVVVVDEESSINAITAISGSGPGYVFYLMEALAEGARALGFDEAKANLLVSQTFLGAATLAAQSSDSFATLREKVTSKGGTTFAGLEAMRAHAVSLGIVEGAKAAMARAEELQKGA
ncbi:MAG TPA: pyrroline-5-carboxylate reductase [Limnobacter sp.]|uniref:pyrroline-5-carboxylate reductase n=1 Tax=Limnobacter sp. TaxID=2003368 RepID=UPI002EDBB78D